MNCISKIHTPLEQMTFSDYSFSISQNEQSVNGGAAAKEPQEPHRATATAATAAQEPQAAPLDKTLIYNKGANTIVGSNLRTLQDMETGQVFNVQQVTKRAVGQKAFWKLYLSDFLSVLGILDSKQIDVLIYILDNTNGSTNTFLGTYRKIAEGAGVSLETARRVMRKLQDNDFVRKIQNGAYQISPKILMKGNERKKSILLDYYYAAGTDHEGNE